ncbi:hypothetical protein K8I85_03725, partial [bacterium]|nr:hypothetical protein [bacterium]
AGAAGAAPLTHDPVVWYDADRDAIPEPAERAPNLIWTYMEDTVFSPTSRFLDPARLVRRVGVPFGGDHVPVADNVNALGEVPNGSWFTNRIGLFGLSVEAAALGPGPGGGPDGSGPWTIIGAKTEGVTPGFNVRDVRGDVFVVKFDPPGHVGMTIGAGVIAGRLLHAAGYNVPDDVVVRFRPEDLQLGEGTRIRGEDGVKRPMTAADLDAILARVERGEDGTYRAIASRFLSGKPIGPFDYCGRRKDDPNDRIPHEDRRELRGLRIFCAWINHYDTKQQNSLDVFTKEGYVRHYLIDFASTMGAAAGTGGAKPEYGYELAVDLPAIATRVATLGLREDPWRRLTRPEGLTEVGYFDSAGFDPLDFDPLMPNCAFANCTDRDGYWAAKIISAFTDEQLEAICDEAHYADPRAAPYVARVLAERRDLIAREFFDRVPPLDFFAWDGDRLTFRDLGAERGVYPGTTARYRMRVANVDAEGHAAGRTEWLERDTPVIDVAPAESAGDAHGFLELECRVDRGDGWSRSIRAVLSRRTHTVVRVDR